MVKLYHIRANQIQENIEQKIEDSNFRYLGDKVTLYDNKPIIMSTNEMIRTIDARSEEKRYISQKFPGKENLIDKRTRENIPGLCETISVIKYYYGTNYYSERDRKINENSKTVECLRYSQVKT